MQSSPVAARAGGGASVGQRRAVLSIRPRMLGAPLDRVSRVEHLQFIWAIVGRKRMGSPSSASLRRYLKSTWCDDDGDGEGESEDV